AVALVPLISRAARKGVLWVHFKEASELCVRFASNDMVREAIQLADALFTPRLEDGRSEPNQSDLYWYKDGLEKVVPPIAGREPKAFLPKTCDWLATAVQAKGRAVRDTANDYSYVWRPAIEEHNQNSDYDFAGFIVGFVRDGFEIAIRETAFSLLESI